MLDGYNISHEITEQAIEFINDSQLGQTKESK